MFDELIREIDRLGKGMEVHVDMPVDEDGSSERERPNAECLAAFKVHVEDWTNLVNEEAAYCPVCRHEADSQSWWTSEQVAYAKRVAMQQFRDRFNQAMRRGVAAGNRRAPRGGLLTFSLSYQPGHREFVAPLAASDMDRPGHPRLQARGGRLADRPPSRRPRTSRREPRLIGRS